MKPTKGKYTPGYCKKVVEMSKEGATPAEIAAAIGVAKKTVYNWIKDPNKKEFKEAWEIARTAAEAYHTKELQDIISSKQKGNIIGKMYYMKCAFKEEWRETDNKQQIEITNKSEGMNDDELNQRLVQLLNAMGVDTASGIKRIK
jgi:transposase